MKKVKVLLVHNYYGSEAPSGENNVVEAERALLEKNGHAVTVYSRSSDQIRKNGIRGAIRGGVSTPWNPIAAAEVGKLVRQTKPHVVHVHNTFPLISPSIFHSIGQHAARVLTLHNYRLLCPAAIPMRSGKVCTDCIDRRSILPSLRYGCYRGSRAATLPLAANVLLHRLAGTWRNQVDAFIALSEFQKELMARGGLPISKVHVKPNFYAGNPKVAPLLERPNHVVFVGRLGEEKGVRTLISAWRQWGDAAPLLRMIGDGPLRDELIESAKGLRVEIVGQISAEKAQEQIACARMLILPSEWFEGFPMVVREAFAFGTPVAASNIGPLPSIVQHGVNGVVFEASNPSALVSVVKNALENESSLALMAHGARNAFEELYNEKANYYTLMQIYEDAMKVNTQGSQ